MTRRRRSSHVSTEAAEWVRDRDFLAARHVHSGLGIRPEGWWRFESDRPDLADDCLDDVYVHLRDDERRLERAAERLRYLVTHRQLSAGERQAIADGNGPQWEWRRAVLTGRRMTP